MKNERIDEMAKSIMSQVDFWTGCGDVATIIDPDTTLRKLLSTCTDEHEEALIEAIMYLYDYANERTTY